MFQKCLLCWEYITNYSVDVFGKDMKCLAVRAQRFPSYQRVFTTKKSCNVVIVLRVQFNWFY
jgi:hypothetical protein